MNREITADKSQTYSLLRKGLTGYDYEDKKYSLYEKRLLFKILL